MSTPDQQIHPHATGRAAQTVEQHQEPQDLVFYSGWVGIQIVLNTRLRLPELTQRRRPVLPVRAAELDLARGARDPVPVQGGEPVQEGEALPWLVLTDLYPPTL